MEQEEIPLTKGKKFMEIIEDKAGKKCWGHILKGSE